MRAIHIDAKNKVIKEIEIGANTLDGMQEAVGGSIERAHTLDNNDDVYVNEEGVLEMLEYGFILEGAHQPFLGNGVVVASDEEGETVAAHSTVAELEKLVQFKSLKEIVETLNSL